jgi:hypothetical protein
MRHSIFQSSSDSSTNFHTSWSILTEGTQSLRHTSVKVSTSWLATSLFPGLNRYTSLVKKTLFRIFDATLENSKSQLQ